MTTLSSDGTESFLRIRPRLVRIAYRMLGSVAEAEDVVQDAYLRWHRTDRAAIESDDAFLVRMVTRLCLDVLKSARVQKCIAHRLPKKINLVANATSTAWRS